MIKFWWGEEEPVSTFKPTRLALEKYGETGYRLFHQCMEHYRCVEDVSGYNNPFGWDAYYDASVYSGRIAARYCPWCSINLVTLGLEEGTKLKKEHHEKQLAKLLSSCNEVVNEKSPPPVSDRGSVTIIFQ